MRTIALFASLSPTNGYPKMALISAASARVAPPPSMPLAAASVATQPAALGARLFCVGNPSNVDLESLADGGEGIEFEPPTFHTSVGECLGYIDPATQAAMAAQQARGRAPTRGELKLVAEAAPVGACEGTYLQHSCWTYWGHSGAPLFDEAGRVAGLHCAWDDRTGMRHGQKLQHLQRVLELAAAPSKKAKRVAAGANSKRGANKRRRR